MQRTALPSSSTHPLGAHVRWGTLALVYVAVVVYGTLYPFSGWISAERGLLGFLTPSAGRQFNAGDVLTNVLAYMPLGFLLVRLQARRMSPFASVALAALCGATLSFSVEFVQQFLPARVSSVVDLLMNSTGTLVGAVLGAAWHVDSGPMAVLLRWRRHWFRSGRLADVGLLAIGFWMLSQLSPLVPSLDVGELRHGLAPLWNTLLHPATFDVAQCSVYVLNVAGLGLLASTLAIPGRPITRVFAAFVVAVLLYKIPVVSRQLSLEALAGASVGLLLASAVRLIRGQFIAWIAVLVILAGFAVDQMRADPGGLFYRFTWIPFSAHLEHPLVGMASILESLWPATALAYLVRRASDERHRALLATGGGLFVALTAFAFEWHQQQVQGRVGDVTTVLLMLGAWAAVWRVPAGHVDANADAGPGVGSRSRAKTDRRHRVWSIAIVLVAIAVVAIGGVMVSRYPKEVRVDESRLHELPLPEQLPAAPLANFRYAHPRLPYPTEADLHTLRNANPRYLQELRRQANGGSGNFDAVMRQAALEPGSVDLDLLLQRLLALQPSWRGHEQGKPLALAYDWLYGQWSEAQRLQLREKTIEACDYLIDRIRKERLSPYNVYLYNSPLQALMACSIALYGDDPHAAPIMNFTYDLWKNRVLPVWRQIMGKSGGWHEGGEYVGIGIGQAIYQLPAMWRSATGEDLIASEPGIRGFLDFLVYRTRPDGTHMRWGDGAFFDRIVPDAAPFALELSHAAAYTLNPPPGAVPTGWPWGPLGNPRLVDPAARSRLPLTKFFDGIGLLVARSDWGPDASYVTFRAGDNFWSHQHLDAGAFTIYKGGPLAIDSGLYGPQYGSDHHMNYAYQAIAHNVVTVTDPEDKVPAPGRQEPRPIANDGGQRRIGSGWGVEPAPLDLAEWNAKRDIYHTGRIEQVLDEDGLAVAQADVTPAYTNELSGRGMFSHRTRRVERLWRTFGYDRVDDVVVVFDQVRATKASFRKRWLLHTLDQPTVSGRDFRVRVAPQQRTGRAGGSLAASVLLPKDANVNAIGGRGLDFFVDGVNYDEHGTLLKNNRRTGPNNGEPGAWRIEVSPARENADDQFLVVLLPTLGNAAPSHRVRLLESGNRVGCEVVGSKRTTRWWFEPGSKSVEIELVDRDGATRKHRLMDSSALSPVAPSWIERLRAWGGAWR
jgi:VanZ family protein